MYMHVHIEVTCPACCIPHIVAHADVLITEQCKLIADVTLHVPSRTFAAGNYVWNNSITCPKQ